MFHHLKNIRMNVEEALIPHLNTNEDSAGIQRNYILG